MSESIKVTIVEFGNRPFYLMQYVNPMTGRKKTKSSKIVRTGRKKDRDAALTAAGKWQAELREGRYHDVSKMTWAEFRERYQDEVLVSLSVKTDKKNQIIFRSLEAIINPKRLRDLTADRLSHFQAELRKEYEYKGKKRQRSENTIAGYLAHLQTALLWAESIGLIAKAPAIKMPVRQGGGKQMKGRPITGEEFDRLLAKVEGVVGAADAPAWKRYLRGLWSSGLRLTESLELWWDRDDKLCPDFSGKHPVLRIPAELEKGNQDRLLSMAPEFAELLLATPAAERIGKVFKLRSRKFKGSGIEVTPDRVCRLVTDIGKAAAVKVNTDARGRVKYASCHDLRRSFGERWSQKVMPAVLQQLMRHESIETTMRYYVGRNAQSNNDVLWAVHNAAAEQNKPASNESGNGDHSEAHQTDAKR